MRIPKKKESNKGQSRKKSRFDDTYDMIRFLRLLIDSAELYGSVP